MAKSKFKVPKIEVKDDGAVIEKESLKIALDYTEKTVQDAAEAEDLQKSGWQLIDCHLIPNGKEYKFRKVN